MSTAVSPRHLRVPVIDLFAGPGGLGEGFSALEHDRICFDVGLSVEKDAAAHRTLLLRSFFRQLRDDGQRCLYYKYLKNELTREALFDACPDAATQARSRCLHLELGVRTTKRVYADMNRLVAGAKQWALVGGPPCQAYSVVGRFRLAKMARTAFENNEKHVLYREYLRILALYKPPVFVMENVEGLLSATYGGNSTFERIISDLSSPTVAMRESMKHRTPQKRHRVILLGVRSDLVVPSDLSLRPSEAPTVGDVLADLPPLRSQLSKEKDDAAAWAQAIRRVMQDFRPEDLDAAILETMTGALGCLRSSAGSGGRWVAKTNRVALPSTALTEWIIDPAMDFVVNHETRKHIPADLLRYLFVASYALVKPASPKLHQFPSELLPNHQNVAETLRNRHGFFNDRFRVQVEHQPATTVTCHICKDGHYFIHHDPAQCRSWTVREAARVQTFPDNYFFEGTRTAQYRQMGNAGPPGPSLPLARLRR